MIVYNLKKWIIWMQLFSTCVKSTSQVHTRVSRYFPIVSSRVNTWTFYGVTLFRVDLVPRTGGATPDWRRTVALPPPTLYVFTARRCTLAPLGPIAPVAVNSLNWGDKTDTVDINWACYNVIPGWRDITHVSNINFDNTVAHYR